MFRRRTNRRVCGPLTVRFLTLFELRYIALIPLQTREGKGTRWGRCSASPKITMRVVLLRAPQPPPPRHLSRPTHGSKSHSSSYYRERRPETSFQYNLNTIQTFVSFVCGRCECSTHVPKRRLASLLFNCLSITDTPTQKYTEKKMRIFPHNTTTHVANIFRSGQCSSHYTQHTLRKHVWFFKNV
jgi:hypothetical protein